MSISASKMITKNIGLFRNVCVKEEPLRFSKSYGTLKVLPLDTGFVTNPLFAECKSCQPA